MESSSVVKHIQDAHSLRHFVGLGQRLINMKRETFRETHSDILINIQYIQSELDKHSPHAIQWKNLKRG